MARSIKPSTVSINRSFLGRAKRYIRSQNLVRSGDRVLVALSGGPDSTCLLLTLASLRRSLQFELAAAHFDHGLRGKRAASAEQRFVDQVCAAFDVPAHFGAGDVRSFAKKSKRSIEDAARTLRYEFLASAAGELNCNVVATGHTKDDQAETVLLHIIRGSGLRGLAGMTALSPWPAGRSPTSGLRVIRPLLATSREDTERCCRETGLESVEDPSNRSMEFTRNRIRHELLPVLRRYNLRIEDALTGLAESAADDVGALELIAGGLLKETPDGVALEGRALQEAPAAVRAHAVRKAFAALTGDTRDLGQQHVRAVINASRSTGARLDLPRGVSAEVQRTAVVFHRRDDQERRRLPSRTARLSIPGTTQFGRWRLDARIITRPAKERLSRDPQVAYLDVETCGNGLSVRRRRDGDRFQPLGMKSETKLQDFFVNAHVARGVRDATPLVCAGGRIAWVVGVRPAEWAKVGPASNWVVRVRAHRVPDEARRGEKSRA